MKTGIKLRSNRWSLGDRPSFQKSRTQFELRWIDISDGESTHEQVLSSGRVIPITAPSAGGWVAAIVKK